MSAADTAWNLAAKYALADVEVEVLDETAFAVTVKCPVSGKVLAVYVTTDSEV